MTTLLFVALLAALATIAGLALKLKTTLYNADARMRHIDYLNTTYKVMPGANGDELWFTPNGGVTWYVASRGSDHELRIAGAVQVSPEQLEKITAMQQLVNEVIEGGPRDPNVPAHLAQLRAAGLTVNRR